MFSVEQLVCNLAYDRSRLALRTIQSFVPSLLRSKPVGLEEQHFLVPNLLDHRIYLLQGCLRKKLGNPLFQLPAAELPAYRFVIYTSSQFDYLLQDGSLPKVLSTSIPSEMTGYDCLDSWDSFAAIVGWSFGVREYGPYSPLDNSSQRVFRALIDAWITPSLLMDAQDAATIVVQE